MNVFELVGRLTLDKSGYDEGLDEAEEESKGFGSKLAQGLGTAGKLAGGALLAVGSATTLVTKQAVDAYGTYEQLVGGIETMFGESADTIIENSQKAFATAGMSANQYMENIMGFSASLIQSTGRGAQVDIEELEASLDEEYKMAKRANEDLLAERKQYWNDVIAEAKKSKSPQLEELKKQKEAELTELKRANEDSLKELKAHHEEIIAETEAMNMTSTTTPESLKRASELADMALQDMSDNANKMGTNMESIQNAYQGFAKANYTMLDNLKLGYGGTKEEMKRLLQDAERLSGQEFDISSYADIVEAIHVVQTEMGITGTTAKEASGTIQGSMGAVKASWDNLVIGLANPEADFDTLVNNFIGSGAKMLENMIPTITNAMSGIGTAFSQLIPAVIDQLPKLISNLLPSLVQSSVALIQKLAESLPKMLQAIGQMLPTLIPMIVSAILDTIMAVVDNIDQFIDGIIQLAVGLAEGFLTAMPIILEKLPEIITKLLDALVNAIPMLIDGLIQLVMLIVNNLPTIIQALIEAIPTIITAIVNALIQGLPALIQGAITLVIELAKHLPEIIMALIEAIPQIIMAIIEAFAPFVEEAGKMAGQAVDAIIAWFKDLPNKLAYWLARLYAQYTQFIMDLPKNFKEWLDKTIEKVKEFLSDMVVKAQEGAQNFKDKLITTLQELPSKVMDIGRNIVDGLKNGIAEKWNDLVAWFEGLGQSLIDGWNSVFQISSPSKVFAQMGGFMAEGLELGFNDQFTEFEKDLNNIDLNMSVKSNVDEETTPQQNANEETTEILREIAGLLRGLGVDPNSIFRLVRNENEEFKETTGVSAFA